MVILITEPEPVLIALEAKLYDRPSRPDLLKQFAAQKAQLDALCPLLAQQLDVEQVRLAHWALLPEKFAAAMGDLGTPTMTWETVRDAFADVDQQYFHAVLSTALTRYDDLVAKTVSYQHGELAGAKLVTRLLAGDTTWYLHGPQGRPGRCAAQGRRVHRGVGHHRLPVPARIPSGNSNWFTVGQFIDALRAAGVAVDALAPAPADAPSTAALGRAAAEA